MMEVKSKVLVDSGAIIVGAATTGTIEIAQTISTNIPPILDFVQILVAIATFILIVYRILLARQEYRLKKSKKSKE